MKLIFFQVLVMLLCVTQKNMDVVLKQQTLSSKIKVKPNLEQKKPKQYTSPYRGKNKLYGLRLRFPPYV